jgi:hypothetical protein
MPVILIQRQELRSVGKSSKRKITKEQLSSYHFDTSKYVIIKSSVRRDYKTGRLIVEK